MKFFLVCFVVLVVFPALSIAQSCFDGVREVCNSGGIAGSSVVVEGQLLTVRHVVEPGTKMDAVVSLGESASFGLTIGVARLGVARIAGFDCGGRCSTRLVRVVSLSPLTFSPPPINGQSGGPLLQGGRVVGLIRARGRGVGFAIPLFVDAVRR